MVLVPAATGGGRGPPVHCQRLHTGIRPLAEAAHVLRPAASLWIPSALTGFPITVKVLGVEDQLKMASLLLRGLRSNGDSVDVIRTGEEALWMSRPPTTTRSCSM